MAFSLLNKFIKKVDIVIQIKIISILAPNKANLFCLNIFGIKKFFIFLILYNLSKLIIYFQKNFKFKIYIQIKKMILSEKNSFFFST